MKEVPRLIRFDGRNAGWPISTSAWLLAALEPRQVNQRARELTRI
jgi:hypothetical protein